jgi:hypothetical protein
MAVCRPRNGPHQICWHHFFPFFFFWGYWGLNLELCPSLFIYILFVRPSLTFAQSAQIFLPYLQS